MICRETIHVAREIQISVVRYDTMACQRKLGPRCPEQQRRLPRTRRLAAAVDLIDLEGVCSEFYDWLHNVHIPSARVNPRYAQECTRSRKSPRLHAASTFLAAVVLFPIVFNFLISKRQERIRGELFDFLHITKYDTIQAP